MLEREQALEEEDEEADANEARLMEELRRTTENNRHIPSLTALKTMLPAKKKQPKLDFDEPVIKTLPDRVIIQHIYGRHHEDDPAASVTKLRKTHAYLIACDFSSESMSAIEWTMGTMMRDGDEAHLVVAVNGEEMHPSGRGRSPTKELENIAVALADKSKAILRHMLLYDIKLVAHAVRGRIKDVLMTMSLDGIHFYVPHPKVAGAGIRHSISEETNQVA
ncbi:hypothetical protein BX666DRAFT_1851413 [Dichotomocladium elegans]|nr:hypothetical protein BX666DRAFT_1851413 [Dichotomocladium elegans]